MRGWLRISDSAVMAFVRLLVALCFLGTVNLVWLNNVTTTVLIMIPFKECERVNGRYYNCPSLQAALNLTMKNIEVCNYFVINLQSGVHLITEPIITYAPVSIIGNGAVEIVCQFNAELYNHTGNFHYLHFNTSNRVNFDNVNFDHCPIAIRIFEAEKVMSNCELIIQVLFICTILYTLILLPHLINYRYFAEAVFDILTVYMLLCSIAHFFTIMVLELFKNPFVVTQVHCLSRTTI